MISIGEENPEAEASRLDPIAKYLERRMGIPVEIIGTSGYGVAIEALRAHKIEACTLGPFAYLIASEKANAVVIAMRGTLDGKPGSYAGGLAVPANSSLHSIEDVVKRAKELTVSFVDPASASGNLVQRAWLDTLGIVPERDFRKVVFSTAHLTSAMTLLAGKTDVAAIGDTIIPAMEKNHQASPGALRYIWRSPKIPEGPVAVRKDLPQDLVEALRSALVAMKTDAPDVYINMSARIYQERYRNTKLIAADDTMFDPLRQLARSVHNTKLLE